MSQVTSIDMNWVLPTKSSTSQCDSWVSIGTVAAGAVGGAVVCIGINSLFTMYRWKYRLRDVRDGGPAPGPPPLPIVGNMLDLRREYYKTLFDYVQYPASVFYIMSTPFVVVSSAEGVREVLGGASGTYVKPKYFGYRSKPVQHAVSNQQAQVAAESAVYDPHADSSRIALSAMVQGSFDVVKTAMESLLSNLAASSTFGSIQDTDVLAEARESIIGLNMEVLFNIPREGRQLETSRIAKMVAFAGKEFAQRMVNPLKVFTCLKDNFRYIQDVTRLISLGRFLCKSLDSPASAQTKQGHCADKSIKTMYTRDANPGLSWVHAWVGKAGKIGKLGKVVGLLMASSQTVPLTAVWMLYLISNNKDIRDDLLQELLALEVSTPDDLLLEHIDQLTLADAVVKETLRLYPPFPLIQREAQKDSVLGGISVPMGTPVYVVPWLVHRNPKIWSDPHDFKPRRFLGNDRHRARRGDASSDWGYLPFGRGSRMCAGSKLAITELKVLLVISVLGYEIDSSGSAAAAGSKFPPLGMLPLGVRLMVSRLGPKDIVSVGGADACT